MKSPKSVLVQSLDLGTGPVRVVVKDSIDIAGQPTRAGCEALAEVPAATRHAAIVERTLAAGYRIVGKANLHELAFGMSGLNAWTGTPDNPRFPALIPGGSSSGSAAAVAAGLAEIGIGTDTGGSIRVPAACCGVYGLKPTFGRLDRRGVMPAHSSLDCVGPLSADLDTLIAFMAAVDPTFDATAAGGAPPRLGALDVDADPAIHGAVAACLESAGLDATTRSLPLMDEAYAAGMALINRETYLACRPWLESGFLGADVERRLRAAAETTDAEVREAEAVRRAFTAAVDRLLETHAVLALPTLPHFPLTRAAAEGGQQDLTISALVRPFNLSGHPALSLPLAPDRDRPVSLQLVGRRGDDAGVCRAARHLLGTRPAATPTTTGDAYVQPGR
ncbi:amidase [Halomonas coralii]|uniref:amidase n=1 Tax=Modicisalibacter sp. R2A 31.J TaxID=2831898 RepID=UPI001CCA6151|nr:amidase [Modicisalibacter sp. R2A 31.J]MBZ9558558.1 amidase [Modicisalibacter sp. R2A 31.J]